MESSLCVLEFQYCCTILESSCAILDSRNYRNKTLTAKLLRQGYRYFKLRKAFSKFYRRHSALLEKYSVSLETLLQQGISEPEFYGDLVYRFRKIVGKSNFSEVIAMLKGLKNTRTK